MQKFLFI